MPIFFFVWVVAGVRGRHTSFRSRFYKRYSYKIDAEAACNRPSADEIGNMFHLSPDGLTNVVFKDVLRYRRKLIKIAGLPAMYGYKFYPQKVW